MSDTCRGFVLLLSIVLWSPCLMPLINMEMTVDEAGIRYALALLLAWGGTAIVVSLVKTYTPEVEEEPAPAPAAVPAQAPPPGVEKAQAEVLVERRKTPRDDDAIAT